MTDAEIQTQYNQSTADNITLDYSKWSARQRERKLSTDHNLWQIERDDTLARQRSENAEARARHLNKLDADRKAKQSDADAQTEIQLQPEKKRLQNEWLANNPTQTPADFEKKAWHLLKENLIEQHNTASLEAEKQKQTATGRYSL